MSPLTTRVAHVHGVGAVGHLVVVVDVVIVVVVIVIIVVIVDWKCGKRIFTTFLYCHFQSKSSWRIFQPPEHE